MGEMNKYVDFYLFSTSFSHLSTTQPFMNYYFIATSQNYRPPLAKQRPLQLRRPTMLFLLLPLLTFNLPDDNLSAIRSSSKITRINNKECSGWLAGVVK